MIKNIAFARLHHYHKPNAIDNKSYGVIYTITKQKQIVSLNIFQFENNGPSNYVHSYR